MVVYKKYKYEHQIQYRKFVIFRISDNATLVNFFYQNQHHFSIQNLVRSVLILAKVKEL